jgi:hypothetical protein
MTKDRNLIRFFETKGATPPGLWELKRRVGIEQPVDIEAEIKFHAEWQHEGARGGCEGKWGVLSLCQNQSLSFWGGALVNSYELTSQSEPPNRQTK